MHISHELSSINQLPQDLAITIGNFDGLHLGHRTLVDTLQRVEGTSGTAVITFEPHPQVLLKPDIPYIPLMTLETKAALLAKWGIDYLIVLQSSPVLLHRSPGEFWQELIRCRPRAIVEGYDFRFGHNRTGTIADLEKWSARENIQFQVVPNIVSTLPSGDEVIVRSSLIRQMLVGDRVNEALFLLGHPYYLEGLVAKGYGRGRGLGFPTANLAQIEILVPSDGVYQASSEIDGHMYSVALSIGTMPTFGDHPRQVEAYVLGYKGDLSDQQLKISIERYLRPQVKFKSVIDLVTQIEKDVQIIRQNHGA